MISNNEIYPIKHIPWSLRGKFSPQLILCNNSSIYVVKFKKNKTHARMLANEFVVGNLAKLLSIPIPPFEVIDIPKKFIRENNTLNKNKFKAGSQFGSYYIKNSITFRSFRESPPQKEDIKNRRSLAGLIVLDHWVCNVDRSYRNILFKPLPTGRYFFYIIDQGNCFGRKSNWTTQTLQNLEPKIKDKGIHEWSASLLKGRKEIRHYFKKIESLSDDVIYEVIQSIPEEWDVIPDERNALFTYLTISKKNLPYYLNRFIELSIK